MLRKGADALQIRKSAEDYLETVLLLRERLGTVRSIDVANELQFTKASVSIAMKQFRENDYIVIDENGYITLTPSGLEIAERKNERHELLTRFFIALGISEETAKNDACRIEHDLSDESFEKIKSFCEKNVF